MEDSHKNAFKEAARPLTVYLGESGKPHDSKRVDIIPPGGSIAVSVDTNGVTISDLSKGEGEKLWSIDYADLPKPK